jgi:hypothetical protein
MPSIPEFAKQVNSYRDRASSAATARGGRCPTLRSNTLLFERSVLMLTRPLQSR